MSEIVAYHEQPSIDPETGAEGVLRKEWRLVSFYSYPIKLTLRLFGSHRVHGQTNPRLILERRYIRRGTIEPWEPVDLYETEERAYAGLDIPHTALSETFIRLKSQHDAWREEARAREEADRQREHERSEKRRLRALANNAFTRLWKKSDADKSLCESWEAFIRSDKARENRETYKNDPQFMELYAAAYDSYKLPSKRKAMREFLVYVGELDSDTKEVSKLDLQVFS